MTRHWLAARDSTSIALGRGKVTRQARATVRKGTGAANGRAARMSSWYLIAVAAEGGRTLMPRPEATMRRMASSELPAATRAGLSLAARLVVAPAAGGPDSASWS